MTRPGASFPSIATVDQVVIGRTYLVPTVTYDFTDDLSGALAWPVLGPKHQDAEDFAFPYDHYHYDLRFFTREHFRHFEGRSVSAKSSLAYLRPLSDRSQYRRWAAGGMPSLPDPIWVPLRCRRQMPPHTLSDQAAYSKHLNPFRHLAAKWQGHHAIAGPVGWICPHRRAPLNAQPVIAGVVTCPLHGLRIDVAMGRCLGHGEVPE